MIVQRHNIIEESERNRILGLYGRPQTSESIVIAEWLSPDEKFCIFLDDLIDIEKKIKIGNIWENFDHFKFFLKHSFEVATNVPQHIKESVLTSLDSFLITESNQNMVGLKPFVKELLNENVFKDIWDYTKDTVVGAGKGIANFATTSIAGLKKLYSNIKDGEWKKAFEIIGKGMLFVARSIRSALYHPIGILLDVILVAISAPTFGASKAIQASIWGIVVGLDIYEFITGNYEDPDLHMGWRLLFFGIDILGLATTGVLAKASKAIVTPLIKTFGKGSGGISKAVQSSKPLQGIVQKILNSAQGAGGLLQKATANFAQHSPKLYNFLKGPLSSFGKFVSKMVEMLKSLLTGTVNVVKGTANVLGKPGQALKNVLGGGKVGAGAQAALNVGVPLVGIGTYQQYKERTSQNSSDDSSLEMYLANNRETPETYGGV